AESPARLTLKLGGSGQFSGKLKLSDFTIPFRNTFDPFGRSQFSATFKGRTIHADLTYAVIDGIPSITGTVSGDGWSLPLELHPPSTPGNFAKAGRFTVVLRADPNAPAPVPQGDGFAMARIRNSGAATFSGQL